MTAHQIFASWASVQQTIAKWVYQLLPGHADLWSVLLAEGLVFKANDVRAVMCLLFAVLYHPGANAFTVDLEQGLGKLEERVIACLTR